MKKTLFFLLLIFILSGCVQNSDFVYIKMPTQQIVKLKLADNLVELENGLSNITQLDNYNGMWFDLGQDQQAMFWMKEMKFNLDIIYLDKNKEIKEIYLNQSPCDNNSCNLIISKNNEIRYVLELPAGGVKKYELEINKSLNYAK